MSPIWTRAVSLAVALACAMPACGPAQNQRSELRWILNGPALGTLTTDPDAVSYFAGTRPFVVAPQWRNIAVPASWNAIPTRIFPSYAQLKAAIANGRIAPSIKAVLYDDEGWGLTPRAEQENFADYAGRFYALAHAHGYVVIQTPAINLATPMQKAGERRFDTFLRGRFIATAAKYADAVDIQVQGSQVPASTYRRYVGAATRQARAANPKVLVFAGISTNPSGHHVTADQIAAAVAATRGMVDGYWFNVPQQGPSCPRCSDFRPDMAVDVLRMLHAEKR